VLKGLPIGTLSGIGGAPWGEIAVRGVLAAVLSGIAFFLVLNTLWGPPPATGKNYFVQFTAWVVAWAPGLLALTLSGNRRSDGRV
jgi:hypothetical protein